MALLCLMVKKVQEEKAEGQSGHAKREEEEDTPWGYKVQLARKGRRQEGDGERGQIGGERNEGEYWEGEIRTKMQKNER